MDVPVVVVAAIAPQVVGVIVDLALSVINASRCNPAALQNCIGTATSLYFRVHLDLRITTGTEWFHTDVCIKQSSRKG